VISEDEEFVTSMGSFIDLEMNVAIGYEVKRRITDRNGKRFNSDIIQQTSNAACAIALRNAILRGIPKALWRKVYNAAREAVAGDAKTLDARVAQMFKSFQLMGIKKEQIFAKLDIKGIEDITLDHLVSLRGIYNAIRENEVSAARAFAPADTEDKNLAEKSKTNLDEIKKKYAQGEGPIEVGPLRSAPIGKQDQQPPAEKVDAGQQAAAPPSESAAAAQPSPAAASEEPPREEPATKGPETAGAASGPEEKEHGLPLTFE
jgi:hypothetical protein